MTKKNILHLIMTVSFVLCLNFNFFNTDHLLLDKFEEKSIIDSFKLNSQTYTPTTPISITNDNVLNNTFPGTGSFDDPIRIEGLSISASGTNLISISNTRLYFRIGNNYLDGMNYLYVGIYFSNVSNGLIDSNIIANNSGSGIYTYLSSNNSIFNNSVSNNGGWAGIQMNSCFNTSISNNIISNSYYGNGIALQYSPDNIISNNTVFSTLYRGIRLEYSNANVIDQNFIFSTQEDGIWLYSSNFNLIYSNTVHDNGWMGIRLEFSDNNYLETNMVYNSQDITGFYLTYSNNNILVNNTSHDNNGHGFETNLSANNTLSSNIAFNNVWAGISLYDYSTDHMIINNTVFNNTWTGIRLTNSNDNQIINNTSHDNGILGINLETSNNVIIAQNHVFNNHRGIYLSLSSNSNILTNNLVANNSVYGVFIWTSNSNVIENNSLLNNSFYFRGSYSDDFSQKSIQNNSVNGKAFLFWENEADKTVPIDVGQVYLYNSTNIIVKDLILSQVSVGISCVYSSNIQIFNTTISNATWGILVDLGTQNSVVYNNTGFNNHGDLQLWDAHSTNVTNNIFGSGSNYGIVIDNGTNNFFENNLITETKIAGINLYSGSLNYFTNNTFLNNDDYAVKATSETSLNVFTFNDFFDNNLGFSQARDDSTSLFINIFVYNYWNSLITPDNDGDRVVDQFYFIDGTANNVDPTPLTQSSSLEFLIKPEIISPTPGGFLSGEVLISWNSALDTWNYPVAYNLYYSNDEGITWILIDSDISELSYLWDTTTVPDGQGYIIKIEAVSSSGLSVSIYSNTNSLLTYYIDNTPPSIIITSPLAKTYNSSTISITLNIDRADQILYYIENVDTSNTTWINPVSRILANGNYTLHVYGFDTAGNVVHISVTFTVEETTEISSSNSSETNSVSQSNDSSSTSSLTTTPGFSLFLMIQLLFFFVIFKKRHKSY